MQRARFNLVILILFMVCDLFFHAATARSQTFTADDLVDYLNYRKNTNFVEFPKETLPNSGRVYKTFFGNNPNAKIRVYSQPSTKTSQAKPNGLILFVDESSSHPSSHPRIIARGFITKEGRFDGPLNILDPDGNPEVQLVFNNGALNQIATKGFVSEFDVDEPSVVSTTYGQQIQLDPNDLPKLRLALEAREDFKLAVALIPEQKTNILMKVFGKLGLNAGLPKSSQNPVQNPFERGKLFWTSENTALKVASLLPTASELTDQMGVRPEQQGSNGGVSAIQAPNAQMDFRDPAKGLNLTNARDLEGSQ